MNSSHHRDRCCWGGQLPQTQTECTEKEKRQLCEQAKGGPHLEGSISARHAVSGQTFVRLSCSPIIAATASVQAHSMQFCRAREREATGYTAAVCSVVPSLPLKGESATDESIDQWPNRQSGAEGDTVPSRGIWRGIYQTAANDYQTAN